ncbi:hypothetical protein [Thalassobacillus devorans]|uniref:hypothetical protein n=1 Tax=Thalassobacillus devorans TaxID=279813 RepID=UPI000A1CA161|nr:hypothetical protein [Thalassobacillus devorans]
MVSGQDRGRQAEICPQSVVNRTGSDEKTKKLSAKHGEQDRIGRKDEKVVRKAWGSGQNQAKRRKSCPQSMGKRTGSGSKSNKLSA